MKKKKVEVYISERPWGNFKQFTFNETSTVKIITVNPGEELSLQYHKSRSEFWKVLKGTPQVIIGEKKIEAKEGDEFFIPEEINHRITAGESEVEILEIAFGNFDEKDIVRLEDKYGRS